MVASIRALRESDREERVKNFAGERIFGSISINFIN